MEILHQLGEVFHHPILHQFGAVFLSLDYQHLVFLQRVVAEMVRRKFLQRVVEVFRELIYR